MPRKTYDARARRYRPQGQRADWQWLVEALAASRRWHTNSEQTPGPQRRRQTEEHR